jgi:hypothetical protein
MVTERATADMARVIGMEMARAKAKAKEKATMTKMTTAVNGPARMITLPMPRSHAQMIHGVEQIPMVITKGRCGYSPFNGVLFYGILDFQEGGW